MAALAPSTSALPSAATRLGHHQRDVAGTAFQLLLLGALLVSLGVLAVLLVSILIGALPVLLERGLGLPF